MRPLYFTSFATQGGLFTDPPNGTAISAFAVGAGVLVNPLGLTTDGTNLFYALGGTTETSGDGAIWTETLNGTAQDLTGNILSFPTSVAVDANNVYFTMFTTGTMRVARTAKTLLNPSAFNPVTDMTPAGASTNGSGIVIDGSTLYIKIGDDIWREDVTGAKARQRAVIASRTVPRRVFAVTPPGSERAADLGVQRPTMLRPRLRAALPAREARRPN